MARTIFITGTDTGVGKTLLTGLLLQHLRAKNFSALAMKPFCSGGRGDIDLIQALQPGEITEEQANPFYFPEPIAPLVATRKQRRRIDLRDVLERISVVHKRCEILFIEGSGGLLVPLGKDFFVLDLLKNLKCEVVLVGRNRLGTINHTLLTVFALQQAGINRVKIVLSDERIGDVSSKTNEKMIRKLLTNKEVFRLPYLGKSAMKTSELKKCAKKIKKTLARIVRDV